MSKSSVLGYFARMGGAALSGDYPADANHAMYFANNAQHLYDQSTQVRVNWVATSLSRSPVRTVAPDIAHMMSYFFPVTVGAYGGYPEDLIIRIGGAVGANTMYIEAYVCPATWPVVELRDRDKYIAKLTGDTVHAAGEWIIESRIGDQYDDETPGYVEEATVVTPAYTEHFSSRQAGEVALMRLSIYGYSNAGENSGYIAAVGVREFHYQT